MPPIISVIIPVYNESLTLHETLFHLDKQCSGTSFEIIVADGHPEGTTLRVIDRDDVKKISSPKGRGAQMNRGARVAKGSILLFLHADTRLPDNGFNNIRIACQMPDIVGGAFDLGIDSTRKIFRWIESVASLRSRLTRIPYGDQAIFVKKDHFDQIGGYAEIPIMEDVEFMTRMRNSGKRIHILPFKVRTSARRWETEGMIRCTLKNWILTILYELGVSPVVLTKYRR